MTIKHDFTAEKLTSRIRLGVVILSVSATSEPSAASLLRLISENMTKCPTPCLEVLVMLRRPETYNSQNGFFHAALSFTLRTRRRYSTTQTSVSWNSEASAWLSCTIQFLQYSDKSSCKSGNKAQAESQS